LGDLADGEQSDQVHVLQEKIGDFFLMRRQAGQAFADPLFDIFHVRGHCCKNSFRMLRHENNLSFEDRRISPKSQGDFEMGIFF